MISREDFEQALRSFEDEGEMLVDARVEIVRAYVNQLELIVVRYLREVNEDDL